MQYFPSMYQSQKERPSGKGKFLVGDLEAVGLIRAVNKSTEIHILTLQDYFSGDYWVFFDPYEKRVNPSKLDMEGEQDGYIEDGVRMLMESEAFSFQNGVGFDLHVFEKCFDWWRYNYNESRAARPHSDIFPFKFMDTMLVSQLTYPDRPLPPQAYAIGAGNTGPHSIAAHGIRMCRYKPDHDDWSTLTDAMIHRNIEDVAIGTDMLKYLMEGDWAEQKDRGVNKMTGYGIETAYQMEQQVALMISRQEQRGFRLDMATAWKDYQEIDAEMEAAQAEVDPLIPLRLVTKPYSFDVLKTRFDAGVKAGVDLKLMKQVYNDIHQLMKTKEDGRIGDKATMWTLTTKSGDYNKRLQGYFPEMRGNINDTKDHLVAGAFTPISFEHIGLGNLDYIKEKVLYPLGWRGINLSDSEQEWFDEHGETRYPWSGKIDDDSLKAWKDRQEPPAWAQQVVNYYILRSRRSVILNRGDLDHFMEKGEWPKQKNGRHECRGLLAVAYSKEYGMMAMEYFAKFREWPTSADEDWRVPAAAFSIGTNTFRMRHRFVVNIPARGLRPLRHLFIASKGKKILGCDGAGLELRMLSHFMNDPEYSKVVLHGDIHTHNQQKAGLPTRDMAKTFIYAFLYGSGIDGLARLAGVSYSEMEQCINRFKAELPALAKLIDRCEEAGRKFGYLQSIDGRWGRIRRKSGKPLIHTVLNVLLQMTGSLVMKYGECMAEDQMLAEGVALDELGFPAFVANIHDEVQMEVDEDEVLTMEYTLPYTTEGFENEKKAIKAVFDVEEKRAHTDEQGRKWSAAVKVSAADGVIHCRRHYHRAGDILMDAFEGAGVKFNMRIPLAGEYKIGDSWHDTH